MIRKGSEHPGIWDWAVLIAALAISFLLLFSQTTMRVDAARLLRGSIFLPFQLVLAYGSRPTDTWEEIESLRREIATQSLELTCQAEALRENVRLRELLGFAQRDSAELFPARVVGRGADRFGETLLIRFGEGTTAFPGQSVIGIRGLIGCVISAGEGECRVRTLRNGALQVSGMLGESRGVGLLHWQAAERRLALTGIAIQEETRIGEAVITSGYGGVFSKGIPIGEVVSVNDDSTALVKVIRVMPWMSLDQTEEVFLLGE